MESSSDLRYNHCNSVIQSVVRLAPGTFEVCGRSLLSIRCNILAKKDLIWSTFAENTAPFDLKNRDLFYEYSDGYLTLASSSNGYSPRLEVKKLKLLEDQMNLPKEIIMHTYDLMENNNNKNNYNAYTNNYHLLLSNSMHWDKLLETNNLKNSHFTEGSEFTFKKILSLPGRRYIVFREPAIETQLRENPWTSDRKIVYTRIARICTEDKGFQMPDDGRKLFTSFFKTRLVCQVRSKMQTKYRISSTNRDFNYLVSLSTSYSPEISNDLILYGLFSSRDPQLDEELPPNLANNLVFSGPLALCIYKLSTVDKTIESSDLIMRLPSFIPYHLRDTSSSNENYSNVNFESYISGRVASRYTGGFKRINRDKYPQLKNLTKCPGSSASNKRLALEASLLVDSVYPERLDIVGLIETRSRISAFTIDPRHVSKVYKDKTQPNQIKHIRYTIFYVGTYNGDVFKMLLFNEVEDDFSQHSTSISNHFLRNYSLNGFNSMDFNTPYSSSSIVSTGNIRVLRQLTTLTTNEKITDLLFIYNSFLNRTTEIISSDKQFTYSPMDKFFLLVFNQADIIQIEVTQCDRFKTCKECVALKDPDCYWNEILHKCDTSTDGLSSIITGFHASCGDLDVDKSKIHVDVKRVSSHITPNTSELLSNTPVKRQCPFENERITHYVLKLLFSGFIGVIIGFIIGVILLLIIQKLVKLNKSKCRNVIILNSKNQTERSVNDICNSVSDQNIDLLQHSKQGTVCSHSKYSTCLTTSTINNEQLLMPQMNNTHDPCDYLSSMKFIPNNEKESFPLSEQTLTPSLPLWDNKIYMMSIDGKTNTNPVTKIMNNQYMSSDGNTSQVINTFSSNNDNCGDNFDEIQQYKVNEASSIIAGRTFQKIK
ncbi:unnamed protein product [Trichobilharzia szidati]|nr:unnamed protein product [Trichobilharzia szidati]